MQFLCVRSHQEPQEEISGHALMATCPPHEHIVNHPDVPYPHKTWDVPNPDLMKLLELSERLPLDGEITPIMALKIIRMHERFYELTAEDFEVLKDDLKAKVRCYGYVPVNLSRSLQPWQLRLFLFVTHVTDQKSLHRVLVFHVEKIKYGLIRSQVRSRPRGVRSQGCTQQRLCHQVGELHCICIRGFFSAKINLVVFV